MTIKHRKFGHADESMHKYKKALTNNDGDVFLVHVTSVGTATEILKSGVLSVKKCEYLKKKLLYFFVSKPAYKISEVNIKSEKINRFPFAFILHFKNFESFYHILPFDSGAAINGRYGEAPDPWVFLEDYELGSKKGNIIGHIDWAFGSHENYFDGKIKSELKKSLNHWETNQRSFLSIAQLASPDYDKPDDRASAIEIAVDYPVQLLGNGDYVVAPKQLLEGDVTINVPLLKRLEELELDFEMYDWQPHRRPIDFYEDIRAILKTKILESQNASYR